MPAPENTLLELALASRGSVVVDGTTLRAEDLDAAARAAAAGLAALGVTPGEGVLVVDDGRAPDVLACVLGAWWAGARVVVAPADDATVDSIHRQTGADLIVHAAERRVAGPAVTVADLRSAGRSDPGAPMCRGEDFALDVVSSGTTGAAKVVAFTHDALWRNVHAIARRLRLDQEDVLYTPLPLSAAAVLAMVTLPGLSADASVHLGRLVGPHVTRADKQMRSLRPTTVFGVPYLYDVLSRLSGPGGHDGLRWAVCSSAPLPGETFDRVWRHFGVPPRSSYCLAEAGTVTINVSDDFDDLRTTVGEPLDDLSVRAEPFGDDTVAGRLVVGGESCGGGYRRDGRLEPFPGGEVRTSDLGLLRDRRLVVTGRVDEVIQVAGQNVDLAHIRRTLGGCPGLGEFAVLAGRHDRLGVVPVVLAEARSLTASPREVIDFCRGLLRDIEVPREVRVVRDIPRTATGKARLTDAGSS